MTRKYHLHSCLLLIVLLGLSFGDALAQKTDTSRNAGNDSLHYPLKDRRGDPFSWKNNNPFYLNDTSFIKKQIIYDPETKEYYILEKVGNKYYRKPTYLTLDELMKIQGRNDEIDYFNKRAQTLSLLNQKTQRPKSNVYDKLFDRIFGTGPNGLKVDIKPQGNVDMTVGYQGQNIKNPTLPERARRNGGFDFDMNANVNVMGSIGDKLKLPISYNTLANFDFENQIKLDYKGMDDEIIKSIEAGNISFQSKGTLIPSTQSLFGIKTQLQFGKLTVTAAIANQRAQRQSINLQGGGVTQQINKKLDDYDENRHFLVGQYFRTNYNKTMSKLPVVNSQVQILRMEVWVTNRTGATTDTRNIVGLMDLGENAPYNNNIHSLTTNPLPQNGANDLYAALTSNPSYRNPSLVNSILVSKGLKPVDDYEKTLARKLNSNEYTFNPQAGFVSLNIQLQSDEVLGVAYQYTYNGRVFQVGEFSQDVTVDSTQGVQKVLFLKLLKATSQRVTLPIWRLMMKNVYSLDVTGLTQQDFKLNILYQEPSGGLKRYLPEAAPDVLGKPLLSILNLDRLNNRNDPMPDGQYDFVDGFTVLSQQGKIIFPVLEPFGRDLDSLAFSGQPQDLKNKYVYYYLYDSIKAIAQTYANLNRFVAQGTAKGSSTSDIYLGAFNIPPGSVIVTAGGQTLRENVDYMIDYNLGTLKVLNAAIINSGVPVQVQFENNAGFGMQQRSFLGLRLDYKVNKKLSLGGTIVRLSERPYFTKMNYGEDPIRNTMFGLDFNYRSEWPGLTRFLNKLPNYSSTTMSNINAYGEFAALKPGHPPQIGTGDNGLIYIDDFEGTRSSVDMRFPFISWALASTPAGNGLFPEATLADSVDYGKHRAKLAWYNIEPTLQDKQSNDNPLKGYNDSLSDPRVRAVYTNELFPQKTTNITDVQTATFDLSYYPKDKGPYNYEARNTEIDANGKIRKPKDYWGGIMRSIDQTDFETGNVEFIEFWVQDPFIKSPTSSGGKLYLNLGNISEDVLKDGKRFYENGLNTPTQPAAIDSTSTWGRTPVNPIQVTQAFSNDPNDRQYQDLGFDGLNNADERRKRGSYLTQLANTFGQGSTIYQTADHDPSGDEYVWYRDSRYDKDPTTGKIISILGRYKQYNNPEGNSPVVTDNSSKFAPAATMYPDNEDLNRDNTLNETEEYYEYAIDLKPGMDVGLTKYITDKRVVTPKLANGEVKPENWYLFRVPIKEFTGKIGNIPDFKSIRFMRMYLTGFEDSVTMRFATLDLVRNQWRNFTFQLDTIGAYKPLPANSPTTFDVLAVNLEENSSRQPIPYKIPPGIERVQMLSNNGVNLLQNEQSMSLRALNLAKNDSRAVFKTMNLDMRQYGRLSMFIHAESVLNQPSVKDGDVTAIIRIGQDFLSNYYEIKIPLKITLPGTNPTAEQIWPADNNLDFDLNELVQMKLRRNSSGAPLNTIYRETVGNKVFSVFGNPNLGEVQGMIIALENTAIGSTSPVSTEMWVNELRLSKLSESGGVAAVGRMDVQLADLGTLSVSGNMYTAGFGTLEQRVNERARNSMLQYDAALNIDAGKLLPKGMGATIPIYAGINRTVLTPKYDPYDQDVLYKYKLNNAASKSARDSIKKAALDQLTIKTINFTNVRFGQNSMKKRLWSISNFDFSYSFTSTEQTNPLITENLIIKQRFGLGYTFSGEAKYWEPFKKMIRNKSHWLDFARDFNMNPVPSLIGFRVDINRQFGQYVPRIVNTYDNKVDKVDTTYDKYFTFDRYYNLRWDLTRSLNIDFSATNFARVDEPTGRINTKEKKDSMWGNFWSGGRNTLYQQKGTLSYNIPLNKIPATDWITARYSYSTNYNWIGASLLALNLGNAIENGQQNNLTAEFDFSRLYAKSKWLNAVSQPPPPPQPVNPDLKNPNNATTNWWDTIPTRAQVVKDLKGKEKKQALRKWRQLKRDGRKAKRDAKQVQPDQMGGLERTAGKLATMIKRVSANYSENYASRVPGYMDSSRVLGQNFNSMQPGLAYVFGKQPDTTWLNRKAAEGVITKDSTFNLLYQQNFEQKLSISAQIEPIRDLIIDINIDKAFTKDYSELYKDTTGSGNHFGHLSPYAMGGFSVSYISYQTLFQKYKPTEISGTFMEFQNNRIIVSKRVAALNPYWDKTYTTDGFANGYGRYSQDVLIPAFLAAYTGKDPNTIPLVKQSNPNIKSNPFSGINPLPNWRLTYTGLARIPSLANTFSSISITHGYNGTLSMNSFTSALNFQDPYHYGAPKFIDTVSGNFVPFFLLPNLTISERFEPLIGIDVTTVNQMNIRFEFKKSRQLSLSLIDYQLSEVRSTEWSFGGSYRAKGFELPFKIPFTKSKTVQNDMNFRLDLGLRDDTQSNSRLDQANAYSTGGQKVINIEPSIDYVLNNRINVKFFFSQQRIIPYISTSAPITNTKAGLQIRVSLAP